MVVFVAVLALGLAYTLHGLASDIEAGGVPVAGTAVLLFGLALLIALGFEFVNLWRRYQPGPASVSWFRERVGDTGARMRKVMVAALARKLLVALWRFATPGVASEGAVMKPAT